MGVPNARTRRGDNRSSSDANSGDGLSSGGVASTVLAEYGEHPPLMQHVNNCDHCLGWLLTYTVNYVRGVKRERDKR